jgi:hypothetical protein
VLKTGEKVLIQHEEHDESSDVSEEGEWEDDCSEDDEAWNKGTKDDSRRRSKNIKAPFPLVMRLPGHSDPSESSDISQDDQHGGLDTSDSESQNTSDSGNDGKRNATLKRL